MTDPCTKFEVSSVIRCGDITRGVKFYKGHLTLTTPLSGKIFYRQGEMQRAVTVKTVLLSHKCSSNCI